LTEAGYILTKGGSMMMRRRTEITVETRSLVLRRSRHHAPLYCTTCPAPTLLIAPDEAAALAGVSTRTIYRFVETEQLHYTETGGRLVVCPNSLPVSGGISQ
jgi:predicted DNA-binding transcriptional regulator AlpA